MHETNSPESADRQPEPARTTVLLVEDNVLIRLSLAEELRAADYVVIEAGNAEEGLSIVRSGTGVDILISDVRMPGAIDGIDLAHTVRKERPAIKLVLVTGQVSQTDGLPVDGVFGKPYDAAKLLTHLKRLTD